MPLTGDATPPLDETARAILDAASRRFLHYGYGKTTIKVALLQELHADPAYEIGIVNNPMRGMLMTEDFIEATIVRSLGHGDTRQQRCGAPVRQRRRQHRHPQPAPRHRAPDAAVTSPARGLRLRQDDRPRAQAPVDAFAQAVGGGAQPVVDLEGLQVPRVGEVGDLPALPPPAHVRTGCAATGPRWAPNG